jgi:hypothetical protein
MWLRRKAQREFGDHPHALRTWVRGLLPWFLIDWGFASFGEDCEKFNAHHKWCNLDDVSSRCMFCGSEREGQSWRTSPYVGAKVWHRPENAERLRR